jgi:hypothetical protein
MEPFDINNIFLLFAHFTPLIMIIIMVAIGLSSGFAGASSLALFIITIVLIQVLVSVVSPKLFSNQKGEDLLINQKACSPSESDFFIIVGKNPYHIGMGIANMMFTFVYSIMAMLFQNNVNVIYITFFFGLIIHYIYQIHKKGCFDLYLKPVLLLGFIGAVTGFLVTNMFATVEDENLLMFQKSSSNNKQCGKEGGQRFKCKVYKNGKLIQ